MEKEKEVLKVKDRKEFLKELREMTEVSISHLPKDDYEEALKLLKVFFGQYFKIPDEFTFGELREKVLESNINEGIKEEIVNLTNSLDKSLYTSEESSGIEFGNIRNKFITIMDELIPLQSQLLNRTPKKGFSFFNIFKPKSNKDASQISNNSTLSNNSLLRLQTKTNVPKIKADWDKTLSFDSKNNSNKFGKGISNQKEDLLKNVEIVRTPVTNNLEEKAQEGLLNEKDKKSDLEKPIENKEMLKLNDKPKNKDTIQDIELTKKIDNLSSEFENLKKSGVNNPFLELEFKSLIGDYKLYQLNQNPERKEMISIKINKLKSRIEKR